MPNASNPYTCLKWLLFFCIAGVFLSFFQTHPSTFSSEKNNFSKQDSVPTIILDNNIYGKILETRAVKIWVDSFSSFRAFEQITKQAFRPNENIKIGDDEHAYWLQFEVNNSQQDSLHIWLNTSVFDSLSLFTFENQHLIKQEHRGLLINYNETEKQHFCSVWQNKYGFKLSIPPATSQSYYLRISNVVRAESELAAFSLEEIPQRIAKNGQRLIYFMLFSAAFFSVLFFLFLFSLLQYVQNRDKSYGFYALYLFFCYWYYWWKFEKSNSFINAIFTSFPDWYYYIEVPLWSAMYLTYMLFVMYFIDTKKNLPFFHRFLYLSILSLSAYVVLDRLVIWIWGLSVAWSFFAIVRLSMAIISIVMIYLVFRAKQRLGFYILWGSLLMLIGGFITLYLSNTMRIHYVGPWDIPLLPIQLGVIFEVCFFFIGLGYKSRLAEREKTIVYQNLQQQQKETEKIKARKEFLSRWYTNISHEFRTPLTVIGGVATQIKGNDKEKKLILKNNKQLLTLVNQMLDLSKLEANSLTVYWIQRNIIHFLKDIIGSFQTFAQQRKVKLSFHTDIEHLIMDIDPEKMQQIITNLLHNAVKFTEENGQVKVNVSQLDEPHHAVLKLDIIDTGQGIPLQDMPYIFDRFYQVDNSNNQQIGGTGIGLALTKELTKLLDGRIKINSKLGQGTKVELLFPIKNTAKLTDEHLSLHAILAPKLIEQVAPPPPSKHKNLPILLLVEDNQDVLHYLISFLQKDYQLLIATNGEEGIRLAIEQLPDLVISDIMMPKKNGFELCKSLKKNWLTSHIPIILLTAKATMTDRISGLSLGADAYLSKPFHQEELLVRLKKLIENRQLLQQYYTQNQQPKNSPINLPNIAIEQEKEKAFLLQLDKIIHKNLNNTDFDIPKLCRDLTMSKTQVYRKVKALTGKTVALYIRSIRLNKARTLLKNSDISIRAVVEQVGFSDASYFSRVFKQEFGFSPSERK